MLSVPRPPPCFDPASIPTLRARLPGKETLPVMIVTPLDHDATDRARAARYARRLTEQQSAGMVCATNSMI